MTFETVPVVFWNLHEHVKTRGMWDQAVLEDLFGNRLWPCRWRFRVTEEMPDTGVAVVVVPGRFHADDIDALNTAIAPLDGVVLIVTSDEERLFHVERVQHPNMRVWVQTPRPGERFDRVFGVGYPPDTPAMLAEHRQVMVDKPGGWFFAGQVTHRRREEMRDALTPHRRSGHLLSTRGFTQGWPRTRYLRALAAAKVAPAPSGPVCADTFRVWEALEAGCIPLPDSHRTDGPEGYWHHFQLPEPPVAEWDGVDVSWTPGRAARWSSWWQQEKRDMARDLTRHLTELSHPPDPWHPSERVTVLIPTSPCPTHPDTGVIEETVRSVRARLPYAEMLILCDGVRSEQADRTDAYTEYVRRVTLLCEHEWFGAVPIIHDTHRHQGLMTRLALELVDTPLVLFVEHDTPLVGDVPWQQACDLVEGGALNVLRFHHETRILGVHRNRMLDRHPVDLGLPVVRTFQWSQRPHLASTAYYREMCDRYFGWESRTMIEDVMHGVVHQAWVLHKQDGWDRHRVGIFHPDGNIQRSTHLDGRGGDPKFEDRFVFAYDSDDVPEGAPYPTAWRVD